MELNLNPPVASIVCFPVKDGSSTDGHDKLLLKAGPPPGFRGGFWGWQALEDGSVDTSKLHWLLNWDSYEAAQRFSVEPVFPHFASQIFAFSGIPRLYHAALRASRPDISSAPVIEWCRITLQSSTTLATWRQGFSQFEAILQRAPGYWGHRVGFVVEEPMVFLVLIGWESIEAHMAWFKTGGGKQAVDFYIRGGTESFEMVHVIPQGPIPNS